MKSGRPHRAVAIGLVVCSSVVTVYVNATAIHVKETYSPLQPATIEASVPETAVYVDPLAVNVSKTSKPKAKKPPVTTVVPVTTIAPTTTIGRDRDKEEDDDEEKDD